jgi:hypothetical protein
MKKVNISELFQELEKVTKGKDNVFVKSGMYGLSSQLNFGFFPLGSGKLVNQDMALIKNAEIIEGGILFLGNDFGTIRDYLKNNATTLTEKKTGNQTVAKILKYFRDNNIENKIDHCFFSNIHLGLRIQGGQMTRIDKLEPDYIKLCAEFLVDCIVKIKPKLIVAMGKETMSSMQYIFPELPIIWGMPNSYVFKDLEQDTNNILVDLSINKHNTKVLCMQHISMANSNVKEGNMPYEILLKYLKNF